MSNTMTFKLVEDKMTFQNQVTIVDEMRNAFPLTNAFVVDIPHIKYTVKDKSSNFLKKSSFALAPVMSSDTAIHSKGVIFPIFMEHLFPWFLDIAKVLCAIKIAQAFYQEKRGGRDEGTGMQAIVQYGKWYLLFWLVPWFVELIDQVGGTLLQEIQTPKTP